MLPGPGREDLFELLDAIPITAAVRGNWDDCVLEALDGEYGLEDPQEIQLLRLTQYLMEGLDPKRIDWPSFASIGREEGGQWYSFFTDPQFARKELRWRLASSKCDGEL